VSSEPCAAPPRNCMVFAAVMPPSCAAFVAVAALPVIDAEAVMKPEGFVALYGVNPSAVVTIELLMPEMKPEGFEAL